MFKESEYIYIYIIPTLNHRTAKGTYKQYSSWYTEYMYLESFQVLR